MTEQVTSRRIVADDYAQRLDAHLDDLWDKGILDQRRLDEINEMDFHSI